MGSLAGLRLTPIVIPCAWVATPGCSCGNKEPPSSGIIRIEISAATTSMAVGTQLMLTATAVTADGVTSDVTAIAAWSSEKTSVAKVGVSPHAGRVTALAKGLSTVRASYGGQTAGLNIL